MPASAIKKHRRKRTKPSKQLKHYTYADYLKLDDNNFYEIINGKLRQMVPPAPSISHQEISGNIYINLKNTVTNKLKDLCKVLYSPVDVIFIENGQNLNEADNVLQPDLIVVCDDKRITENYIIGPPDFVIEIVSPSSAKYDLDKKFKIYEKFGVREYWIVFPKEKIIQDYLLKDGKFILTDIYTPGSKAKIQIFDIELDTNEMF